MRPPAALFGALALMVLAGTADAFCRQALVLGLDVSGSVDAREYRLQRDGLAQALNTATVRTALLDGGPPVAVSIFEWSSDAYQRPLIPWRLIETDTDIADIADQLQRTHRVPAPEETALGAAILYGVSLFRSGPDCLTQTIDISGDGKSISGPPPDAAAIRAQLSGITVNGLAIGSDDQGPQDTRSVDVAELSAYFRTKVIHGPDAFVQVAIGFEDYADAMERKLLREIRVVTLGLLPRDLPPFLAALSR